jgi:hypothetical protein
MNLDLCLEISRSAGVDTKIALLTAPEILSTRGQADGRLVLLHIRFSALNSSLASE